MPTALVGPMVGEGKAGAASIELGWPSRPASAWPGQSFSVGVLPRFAGDWPQGAQVVWRVEDADGGVIGEAVGFSLTTKTDGPYPLWVRVAVVDANGTNHDRDQFPIELDSYAGAHNACSAMVECATLTFDLPIRRGRLHVESELPSEWSLMSLATPTKLSVHDAAGRMVASANAPAGFYGVVPVVDIAQWDVSGPWTATWNARPLSGETHFSLRYATRGAASDTPAWVALPQSHDPMAALQVVLTASGGTFNTPATFLAQAIPLVVDDHADVHLDFTLRDGAGNVVLHNGTGGWPYSARHQFNQTGVYWAEAVASMPGVAPLRTKAAIRVSDSATMVDVPCEATPPFPSCRPLVIRVPAGTTMLALVNVQVDSSDPADVIVLRDGTGTEIRRLAGDPVGGGPGGSLIVDDEASLQGHGDWTLTWEPAMAASGSLTALTAGVYVGSNGE